MIAVIDCGGHFKFRKHFNVFKAMVNSTSPAMQKLRANLQRIRTALAPVGTVVKKVGSIFMNVFGGVIAGAAALLWRH